MGNITQAENQFIFKQNNFELQYKSESLQVSRQENNKENDPLKHFFNINIPLKVKTLSEIKTLNQQLHWNSSSNEITQPLYKTNKKLQHLEEVHPVAQVKLQQISIVLTEPNRPRNDSTQFKSININIDKFLKIRAESITQYYQLKEKIGQGSFGQVYRGICKKTSEERAIKILKTKCMKQHQKTQFLSQMTLLSRIDHPNIIKLYDLFHHNNIYYVVTEYCKGGAVIDIMKKFKRPSQKMIAEIMRQLLSALSYLHSMNFIHRDIKLQNLVFLDRCYQDQEEIIPIKIIDFGTCCEAKYKVTQNYPIAGTLSYIAPEVLKKILIDKSDIWSSAILMMILMTGWSPFRGMNECQTKRNVESKKLTFNEPQLKSISAEAKSILQLMLNRDYHKRISAKQCLNHPWFNISKKRKSITFDNLKSLEQYYRGNNLISVIQSFLAIKNISQSERQKLGQMFNEIDIDHNGVIQADELLKVYQNNFGQQTSQEIENILSMIDKNQSGKIDFNEFLIAMYSRKQLFLKSSLQQAFDYFDQNRTGYLEKSEIKEIITGCEGAEIQYFLRQLDTDKDQKISKQEFINYLIQF